MVTLNTIFGVVLYNAQKVEKRQRWMGWGDCLERLNEWVIVPIISKGQPWTVACWVDGAGVGMDKCIRQG